jgi:cell division protein FtsB
VASGELIGATSKRHSGRGRDDRRSMGEQILARRNAGEKMYLIAAELRIGEETARSYMKLALDARIPPTVDEYRRQQNDALDERETMLRTQIDALDAMLTHPDLTQTMALALIAERRQTVGVLLRLDERRAKLNGTDAPVRVDATVTHLDTEDAELSAMIAEERARVANERVTP